MQYEMWMDAVANATGKRAFMSGGSAVVNASAGIKRMEVPTQRISGASGDVHVDGNPHFYYDPVYGKFIARNILRGLIRVDGGNANTYRANYKRFNAEVDRRMASWKRELAPYAGQSVVTYHRNYAYFMRRFGLRSYGHLEPKPGIPPTAKHINALISNMKRDRVRAVVIESVYSTRFAQLIAKETGQSYAVAPYSPTSISGDAYLNQMDRIVDAFKKALS
jgi:ABC-type Zn uptake system ZnuABC Zn-binding protein ZnuA